MPLKTKITNYDSLLIPSDPLSDDSQYKRIFIKRSNLEESLHATTNQIYKSAYDETSILEANMYSNEYWLILDLVQYEVAEGATVNFYKDETDEARASYLLVITSESQAESTRVRIVAINNGTQSPKQTVHKIVDNNFVESSPLYFSEQDVTVDGTTLSVGIIEVSFFDNSSVYFDIDVKTSDNAATHTLVGANLNTDPDALNVHGTTIDAFNVNEQLVLDDNFVYAKIYSSATDILYFKLVQSIEVVIETPLELLQKTMSNKWYNVFNSSTAVEIGKLSGVQVVAAEPQTDVDLRTWLDGLSIEWFDVSVHLNSIIEVNATSNENIEVTLLAYNQSNIDAFVASDVTDLGASIASELFTIFDSLDAEVKVAYTHTINWFKYISTRSYEHIITANVSDTELASILDTAKTNYLDEFAHAANVWKYVNKRYLESFVRKLSYVGIQVNLGLLTYQTSTEVITVMRNALMNIQLATNDTAAFDQYTEAGIDVFANQLEFLNITENTIQRIQWIHS